MDNKLHTPLSNQITTTTLIRLNNHRFLLLNPPAF